MKRSKLCFMLMIAFICVFTGWTACEATSVMIRGKALSEISDVVKQATGSEFPEIQKHSLLFYERMMDNGHLMMQPRVFTISADGSLKQEYVLEGQELSTVTTALYPTSSAVQRFDVAMSDKRFGRRRNVMFVTPGLGNNQTVKGFSTIQSDGSDEDSKISNVDGDCAIHKSAKAYGSTETNLNFQTSHSWGCGHMTIKGIDRDVFVYGFTPEMSNRNPRFYLRFMAADRNESGDVNYDVDYLPISTSEADSAFCFYYGGDIRGAAIATGDFDNDGYKNEIAVCFNGDKGVSLSVYTVRTVSDTDKRLVVDRIHFNDDSNSSSANFYSVIGDGGGGYSLVCDAQPTMNVMAGDFDGDGKQEIATVCRSFPGKARENTQMKITVFKYEGGTRWTITDKSVDYGSFGSPRATRADVDGDGRDEIVVFLTLEQNGSYYPILELWYFDQGSITPTRHNLAKGGRGSFDLLNRDFGGDYLNRSYFFNEAFSITAGPLTGRAGKVKLADDIAISYSDGGESAVYVVPTLLDSNKNFAGFGATKTVYSYHTEYQARRGSVVTSDFANEVLMLGKPVHTMDTHDESFIVVLQALPHHVDNVDTDGNLTAGPINYTFSGFAGDEGNGEMSVTYTNTQTNSTANSVSYNMTSTTDTIALLGDAGPYVHGYLKFRTMGANFAAKADPKLTPLAEGMNSLMDFVTDSISKTNTNGSASAAKETIQNGMTAYEDDTVMMSYAPQHFWRYPILNDPLPKWFVEGQRADANNGSVNAESQKRYLSFSMYDTIKPKNGTSKTVASYQPRHDETNFFSYPATIDGIESYNPKGELGSPLEVAWSKGALITSTTKFENAETATQGLEDEVKRSPLTKLISTIATALGFDDPDPLPPYTSHSETFTKEFSQSEQIDIRVQGRSTLPGENAGHTLLAMPFITREGTMQVGTAVQLDLDSPLWREKIPDEPVVSRYRTYPDPSLVLPQKFKRNGATFAAQDDNIKAMQISGVRYYVPALALNTTSQLIAGMTYKISVPIYNASFLDASFDVKLSYASQKEFSLRNPSATAKEIGTVHMNLGGWSNLESENNKGWAEFEWAVPPELSSDYCRFYVQIDPENKIEEVHESRLDSSGAVRDVGGNNEGYFNFDIMSIEDAVATVKERDHGVKSSTARHSGPVIYREICRQGQDEDEENVKGAVEIEDETGTVKVNVKFEGESEPEQATLVLALFQLIADYYKSELSQDITIPMTVTIEYDGDEYYPEAIFSGCNLKEGVYDRIGGDATQLTDDDIEDAFFAYNMPLIPHSSHEFVMNVVPYFIDSVNGAVFDISVPALVNVINDAEDEETDNSGNDNSGGNGDSGNGDSGNSNSGSFPSSGGGGCDAGFSVLAFGLVLSGLMVGRKRR